MRAYLLEVWRCRHFWMSLVRMDLQVRYRRSVLGIGWSLLHPITSTLVLCAVFHNVFQMPVRDFIPFLMAGLAWWAYVTGVFTRGCRCFVEAEAYIRQHSLPMAVYPLRATLGTMIHFALALAAVVVCTWSCKGFGNLATLPLLPIGLGILFVFGWSVGVLVGFLNTIFRDIQHVTEIGFQILFYLTPVMYPPELLTGNHLHWAVHYNPLVHLLAIVRDPLVAGTIPSWGVYAGALGISCAAAASALLLLGRLQRKLVLYL